MLTRRQTLAGLCVAPVAAQIAGCASTRPLPDTGLNALARTRGLRFGTAMSTDSLADAAYRGLVAHECGILVAENEHKIYVINDEKGVMDFTRGDALVYFAEANGMAMRGHVLLWNRDEFVPDWLKAEGADFDMRAYLRGYIREVATHYGDRIESQDVVNETISSETGGPRDTVYTRALGQDVVPWAFHEAREHLPDAQLIYNDYTILERGFEGHNAGVLRLLEGFRRDGVPIDAVGIQSHLWSGEASGQDGLPSPAQWTAWRKFVDEIAAMGFDIILTEFDVNDTALPADPDLRDQLMAEYTRDYLDMMLGYTEVKDILAWGLADTHSWLNEWWPRADGVAKRMTLFDRELRRKPIYKAVAGAIEGAPVRVPG